MTDVRPFDHVQQALQSQDRPPESPPVTSTLPPVFQFSQNNLQDYADCQRRFQLRYALGQQWPAVESEPLEEREHFIEQGQEFHLLVQRHLSGIAAEELTPDDPLLRAWWESYLASPPPDLPARLRLPETQLSVPIGDQRLMARFDLLAIDAGQRAVIVDWKTARRRPKRAVLAARLQTRIYPFVLVEAGAGLFGGPLSPEQVSLVYWFSEAPRDPETFAYSASLHEENRAYLTSLITEALAHSEQTWPLTHDLNACKFCVYRSLCNRGVRAGDTHNFDDETDISDFDIDLDNVEEIAF